MIPIKNFKFAAPDFILNEVTKVIGHRPSGLWNDGRAGIWFIYDTQLEKVATGSGGVKASRLSQSARSWLAASLAQHAEKLAKRYQKGKIAVLVKNGPHGRYKLVSSKQRVELFTIVNQASVSCAVVPAISEMERALNFGMLADEAEAAFPRLGKHNHAIYKVSMHQR